MAHEMLIGVAIFHPELYAQYRAEMGPLLERAGGAFRCDFEVSRELKPGGDPAINRVFVIAFPDKAVMDAFFADPEYLEIRSRLFTKSVARLVVLAEYDSTPR